MNSWGGGGDELFTYPYPLKVQARPPRDKRLAIQSRVSGGGGGGGDDKPLSTVTDVDYYLHENHMAQS